MSSSLSRVITDPLTVSNQVEASDVNSNVLSAVNEVWGVNFYVRTVAVGVVDICTTDYEYSNLYSLSINILYFE